MDPEENVPKWNQEVLNEEQDSLSIECTCFSVGTSYLSELVLSSSETEREGASTANSEENSEPKKETKEENGISGEDALKREEYMAANKEQNGAQDKTSAATNQETSTATTEVEVIKQEETSGQPDTVKISNEQKQEGPVSDNIESSDTNNETNSEVPSLPITNQIVWNEALQRINESWRR